MLGLFSKTDALELRLRGVTYTVLADAPLPKRPDFVRLRVKADDGRSFTFNLGDGRGLSLEDRAARSGEAEVRTARAVGRL